MWFNSQQPNAWTDVDHTRHAFWIMSKKVDSIDRGICVSQFFNLHSTMTFIFMVQFRRLAFTVTLRLIWGTYVYKSPMLEIILLTSCNTDWWHFSWGKLLTIAGTFDKKKLYMNLLMLSKEIEYMPVIPYEICLVLFLTKITSFTIKCFWEPILICMYLCISMLVLDGP